MKANLPPPWLAARQESYDVIVVELAGYATNAHVTHQILLQCCLEVYEELTMEFY